MLAVRHPVVALVGNPNTGKTTLFNALAGMNQRVGNYPGVTVETKKGKVKHSGKTIEVIDLPGTYSLAARSPDEMVAVDVILGHTQERPDVVVTIVDASNLERNLYLTTQVLELGVPVVVALNMIDVAQGQGLTIDVPRLSRNLGVPIVPVQANKGKGLEDLKDAIAENIARGKIAPGPTFPEAFEAEVTRLQEQLGTDLEPFLVRRLLLDVGGYTEEVLSKRHGDHLLEEVKTARQRLGQAGCGVPGVEARARYGWIRSAMADCVKRPKERPASWTDALDRILTHRFWGTFLFLAVMFGMFEAIFVGASPLMDLVSGGFGAMGDWIKGSMEPGPLRGLLVDGIIGGVGGVVVFLPQILILFAFIACLEDCGYMARAAFLMDRLMAKCGLNGKSFIPLLSSMACAVPGIMAARVIENRRDRFATILVAPLMSCSARLPVYVLLGAAFLGPAAGFPVWVPGLAIFGMYCLGLVVAPLMALLLKRTLLRGETPVFVMEMPLYKRPALMQVGRRSLEAGWMFLRRAGTIILASMILIWGLLYFPAGDPSHPEGMSFDRQIAQKEEERDKLNEEKDKAEKEKAREDLEKEVERLEGQINDLDATWKKQSFLGQMGQALEPVVVPLGWDWRIGMATLASFPAREVIVGTLGIIFNEGAGEADDEAYQEKLGGRLTDATWEGTGQKLFTVPTALSVMVFFALCCQCVSTLAVIKRETNSWFWPVFTFVYMTVLAYVAALAVYQVGSLFG